MYISFDHDLNLSYFKSLKFQGLNKFYDAVMQSILRHVDFNVVKCVILASPGFVKDQCYEYMIQMAIKTDNKLLLDNRGKFLLVKASSGFKHSLKGKEKCYLCLWQYRCILKHSKPKIMVWLSVLVC